MSIVLARARVAEVDLSLTVVSREAIRTSAAQAGHGVDGSEEHGVRRDEGCRTVEAQHGHTLHVVLAGLAQTHVIIEGQHSLAREATQ